MRINGVERWLTVVGYLPLVSAALLMFKVRRDSMFVQFHVRQSWVMFLMLVVWNFLMVLLLLFTPESLASVFIILMFVSWLLYGVMMLFGMVKGFMGERFRMPVVADVALKLGY